MRMSYSLRTGPLVHSTRWQFSNASDRDGLSNTQSKDFSSSSSTLSSFVKSWISTKDRLISMAPATFESQHWMEAEELLNALRTNPKLSDDTVPDRVRYMFDLLDRLADEMEHISSKPSEKKDHRIPLKKVMLDQILRTWLGHIQERTGLSTAGKVLNAKKQRARWGKRDMVNTRAVLGELDAESIMSKVNRYFDTALFEPSTTPFSIILHGMNKNGDSKDAPYRAQEIYRTMLQKSNHDPFDTFFHPDARITRDMVEIWAYSWLPDSCQRVEAFLSSLTKWYEQTSRRDQRPTASIYCGVMETHGRSNESRTALHRILQLFSEMKARCPVAELGYRIYNRVCNALVEGNSKERVEAARTILDNLCNGIMDEESKTPKPDRILFATLIRAYGQLKRVDEAEKLFNQMVQLSEQTGIESLRPDARTYSTLVWAYAKVGDSVRAEQVAIKVFDELDNGMISSPGFEYSNVFDGVLVAWANSGHPDASTHISQWIQRLIKYAHDNQLSGIVNTSTLNKLLESFALMGTIEGTKSLETLLQWMENQDNPLLKPDSQSYFEQILGWCKAGKPDQAEISLRRLCSKIKQEHAGTSMINREYFGIVIEAWSDSKQRQAGKRGAGILDLMKSMNVEPDVVTYNSLIWAWSRNETLNSTKAVLDLFEKMEKQWRDGDAFAKPDALTYNAVICGLGKSRDIKLLDRAERFFRTCDSMDIERDVKMYSSLMSGWMRHSRPDQVEALFQEMKEEFSVVMNH